MPAMHMDNRATHRRERRRDAHAVPQGREARPDPPELRQPRLRIMVDQDRQVVVELAYPRPAGRPPGPRVLEVAVEARGHGPGGPRPPGPTPARPGRRPALRAAPYVAS